MAFPRPTATDPGDPSPPVNPGLNDLFNPTLVPFTLYLVALAVYEVDVVLVIAIRAYNNIVNLAADKGDAVLYFLNNQPIVQDPVGYLGTAVASLQSLVLSTATTYSNIVLALVNQYKSSTVDPTVAMVFSNLAFVQAAIAFYQSQALTIIAQTQTTVAGYQAQADAIIASQTMLVNQQIAALMIQVANTQNTVLFQIGVLQAMVNAQVVAGMTQVQSQIAQVQSQITERPLYYGILSTPITVTSTTDIVQIPAGALRVFLD